MKGNSLTKSLHLLRRVLGDLHFAALRDDDGGFGFVVGAGRHVLDLAHDQEAVEDLAEDDVLAVEEVALGARDEELTAVRVRSAVGLPEQIPFRSAT